MVVDGVKGDCVENGAERDERLSGEEGIGS